MSENVTAHGLKKKAFLAAFRETGNVHRLNLTTCSKIRGSLAQALDFQPNCVIECVGLTRHREASNGSPTAVPFPLA